MSGAVVRGADDPAYVASQYATESGLAQRKSVYADVAGLDARDVALAAVAEVGPERVLEVGCGEGELAERIQRELGVEVVAVDQSPRMVELTRARGVDAGVADVESLPFPNGSFDVVIAAWMLYHVRELDRGLAEIARVLRPGGRLVAVTNAPDHLHEMLQLAGIEGWELPFDGGNGAELLTGHFALVERREAYGTVVFADIDLVRTYFGSSERLQPHLPSLPEALEAPLVVRRKPVVFVAE